MLIIIRGRNQCLPGDYMSYFNRRLPFEPYYWELEYPAPEDRFAGGFQGYYDADKYKQAQNYLKENTRFEIITDSISLAIILTFILAGGFNLVDRWARNFHLGPISTGLVFAGALLLAFQIIHLPFSAYHTFVIEEKYGFNRTTVRTFILDILKSWLLVALIGGAAFSGIL